MGESSYKGSQVQVVRPAQDGDRGYDAKLEQVLVRFPDGREELANKSDVQGTESAADAPAPAAPVTDESGEKDPA